MAGEDGGGDAEDRTEDPTPRRLERAREEGQVPLSREAVGFATMLAAALAAMLAVPPLGGSLLAVLRGIMAQAGMPGTEPAAAALGVLQAAALLVLPVCLAVGLAAALATLAQTGWPQAARGLTPDLSRLNPLAGLKRLLGPEMLVELLRALLKLGAVGAALWTAADPGILGAALMRPAGGLLGAAEQAMRGFVLAALLAFAGVAALDLLWTRWQFLRRLRMSRQDLKEEMRESEGDPMLKARRRRIAEQRVRRRMIAAVPKAAVVITNPTHYAVALAYAQGDLGAPVVVAKGVDAMAARIRQAAREHGVPVVENPPLARALHRLEPDTQVPVEHWQAVAEILAYVWRLRGRAGTPTHGA